MKTLFAMVFLIGLVLMILVSLAEGQVRIDIGGSGFHTSYRFYQPAVLKWRILIVSIENGCTMLRYFTASGIDGQAYQFLGDEVFCGGQKVQDTYTENDRE